jgi:hypothetical protein
MRSMRVTASTGALLLFACLSGAPPVSAELVSHWRFDGDFADSGPAGNHGLPDENEALGFSPGRDGAPRGALSLDGVESLLRLPHTAGLPFHGHRAYSIAFWVKGGPQSAASLVSESSVSSGLPLFSIGPEAGAISGRLRVLLRDSAGNPLLDQLSSGEVFGGEWRHFAWVDNHGQAVLYIDGRRDPAAFDYRRPAPAFELTALGGVGGAGACCFFRGAIDDLRLYDHPLSEFEVQMLLERPAGCPEDGDTHCGSLVLERRPGSEGTFVASALGARDDSGDPVRYFFMARSDSGITIHVGPQPSSTAELELGPGTWTVSVTVDDDPDCPDLAADATCVAPPVTVACPSLGDTHCGELLVDGPTEGGAGFYVITVLGATDDSGDAILYLLSAESDEGRVLRRGPQDAPVFELDLSEGRWTITVTVDDDLECADQALDATCTIELAVGCPLEGDTLCGGLVIDTQPDFTPGPYLATVTSATDASGDLLIYTFVAESDGGRRLEVGPQLSSSALFILSEGEWTISATVDDDLLCPDRAPGDTCREELEVRGAPPRLISHWSFDGHLADAEESGNHGSFAGGRKLAFTEGFDGGPRGALLLPGFDACVGILPQRYLPLHAHRAFTVALWVRGTPQPGGVVWSEGTARDGGALFAIGTEPEGRTGQVSIHLRNASGQELIAQRLSRLEAFDGAWRHLAWTSDGGRGVLYVDGVRDPTDFSRLNVPLEMERTAIGCAAGAGNGRWFEGAIDEVRVFSFALGTAEIRELIEQPDCPLEGDSYCDDFLVEPPPGGGEGVYGLAVLAASDDSRDPLFYTFTAEEAGGRWLQAGPQPESFVELELTAGVWTLSATVDDDLHCLDESPDATCTQQVTVERRAGVEIAHWSFDGHLDDLTGGNHGALSGVAEPRFGPDREGRPRMALLLDGRSEHVRVLRQDPLLLHAHREYSLAMWVKGAPKQDGKHLWSETSRHEAHALFSVGTDFRAGGGQVGILIRDESGVLLLSPALSRGVAFDGDWHHIAWVDAGGRAALYIDGRRDPTRFDYEKRAIPFDLATIGGSQGVAVADSSFEGLIDDVRAYDYALDEAEVQALAEVDPRGQPFYRGDPDGDGRINITDAIFLLNYLFLSGPPPGCREAADPNDDGGINITDAIYLLNYLFLSGPPPADPGPPGEACAPDPEGSVHLGCDEYRRC